MYGDIIEIKPGDAIPVDGVIIEGNSYVNQASITGESVPVYKGVESEVIAGTINKNGYFKMRATKVGENTTIAQIIKLVDEASSSKAPISKLADKVSYVFVPVVIIIAVLAGIVWLIMGQSFEFALSIGISVLVISCPCALGLATPVAIMVGTGKGAENGILIKSAESLELLHEVDTIVLDKTGTITEGKLKVTDLLTVIDENQLLKVAASLESHSEHPLAEAIIEAAKSRNLELEHVDNFAAIPGRGIIGEILGIEYFAGNLAFMQENDIQTEEAEKQSEQFLSQGKTVMYFARRTEVIGLIAVSDIMKEKSQDAIKEFKKRNLEVVMITGDNSRVANAIGKKVKVDKIVSEVLPQDKEKEVEKLQAEGKKVAFVGDGINDSPALIKADVGIAIGSGTDIAIDSADVVLVRDNLYDVAKAIDLSKATINNIKINLFWAFFYNSIGIPIACGILYPAFGIKLNPMFGAAAMSLSSVCVVTNALRLRKFKFKSKEEEIVMSQKVIEIEGMKCEHCQATVEKALRTIGNVTDVVVSLDNKTAAIESVGDVDDEIVKKLIKDAGFEVVDIK